jgi:hypothetical protein
MNTNYKKQGPVAQLAAAIVGILTLTAALMFSAVFFVVLALAGLIVWAYFWWKTKALRKAMREQMAAAQAQPFGTPPPPQDANIIEGEAVRIVEEKDRLS